MSGANGKASASSSSSGRFALEVAVLTVGWYGASIISSNTSKQLLSQPLGRDGLLRIDPLSLTCIQLWLSTFCGFILIRVFGVARWRSLFDNTTTAPSSTQVSISPSNSLFARMTWLGMVFLGGFLTLNAAMRGMSVSLANTLRALEPIVSLFLSYTMLDRRSVTPPLVMAVLPIVVGAAMASYGNADFSLFGFLVIMISNVCFALRTVLYKGIRQTFGLDNVTMFFNISLVGACVSGVGLVILDLFFLAPGRDDSVVALVQELVLNSSSSLKILLLTNGVTFFMYLQLSFVVLSRVTVVTHAVANAFRRPAVIVASIIQFNTQISFINSVGVAVACGGVLLYSYVKSTIKAPPAAESIGGSSDTGNKPKSS